MSVVLNWLAVRMGPANIVIPVDLLSRIAEGNSNPLFNLVGVISFSLIALPNALKRHFSDFFADNPLIFNKDYVCLIDKQIVGSKQPRGWHDKV